MSFVANNSKLTNVPIDHGSFNEKVILGKVHILGLTDLISKMYLNHKEIKFRQDSTVSSQNLIYKNYNETSIIYLHLRMHFKIFNIYFRP